MFHGLLLFLLSRAVNVCRSGWSDFREKCKRLNLVQPLLSGVAELQSGPSLALDAIASL